MDDPPHVYSATTFQSCGRIRRRGDRPRRPSGRASAHLASRRRRVGGSAKTVTSADSADAPRRLLQRDCAPVSPRYGLSAGIVHPALRAARGPSPGSSRPACGAAARGEHDAGTRLELADRLRQPQRVLNHSSTESWSSSRMVDAHSRFSWRATRGSCANAMIGPADVLGAGPGTPPVEVGITIAAVRSRAARSTAA